MTATARQARPVTPVVTSKPSRQEVVDLIVRDAGCTPHQAHNVLNWIGMLVETTRCHKNGEHYMTPRQLRSPNYLVFDAIMQHGTAAKPGSAHEGIEKLFLNPSNGEYGIMHDVTTRESVRYCTVKVTTFTLS